MTAGGNSARLLTRVVVIVVAATLCMFAPTSHAHEEDVSEVLGHESSPHAADRSLLSDWESRVYSQSEHKVRAHYHDRLISTFPEGTRFKTCKST